MTMTLTPPAPLPSLNFQQLDRDLDRAKTKVFLGKSAAFLGSLMCTMKFVWDESIPTAATDGQTFWWNPQHFYHVPAEGRPTIIVHELWHKALLHMLRRGDRHPRLWNQACDYAINNMMDKEGYPFDRLFPPQLGFPPDTKPCLDHRFGTLSAEEIYDQLVEEGNLITIDLVLTEEDLVEPEAGTNDAHVIVNSVVAATHSAKLGGMLAGSLPDEVELTLRRFLKPKLPWKELLQRFFTQFGEKDWSWKRPNRRYSDMYLPGMADSEQGRLAHLIYYLDVSGSISNDEIVRFNSEVKHIKDTYNPDKLTLVQFDTMIQVETVFSEEDSFEELHVIGRGGTSLVPVRDHIIEHRPTAAVVFSDLYCNPMQKLPFDIPVLWVVVNNKQASVNEGQMIHIRE